MALSRDGLIGCAIYACFCAVLFFIQIFVSAKASVLIMSIAFLPGMFWFYLFGLSKFFSDLTLMNGLVYVLSFVTVYCIAWTIGALARRMGRIDA